MSGWPNGGFPQLMAVVRYFYVFLHLVTTPVCFLVSIDILCLCVCVSICSVFSLHYLPASTRLEDHQRWCGGDYLGESVPMGRWKRSTVSRWMCIYRGGPPNQGVDRVDWSSSFFQGVELGGLPILIHTHIYRCFPRRSRLPLPT